MNVQAQICPKRKNLAKKTRKKIAPKGNRVSKTSHTKNDSEGEIKSTRTKQQPQTRDKTKI